MINEQLAIIEIEMQQTDGKVDKPKVLRAARAMAQDMKADIEMLLRQLDMVPAQQEHSIHAGIAKKYGIG